MCNRTITFYSLSRRTATDFALLVGADHARRLLGHGLNTRTLERYYMNDVNRTSLSDDTWRDDESKDN